MATKKKRSAKRATAGAAKKSVKAPRSSSKASSTKRSVKKGTGGSVKVKAGGGGRSRTKTPSAVERAIGNLFEKLIPGDRGGGAKKPRSAVERAVRKLLKGIKPEGKSESQVQTEVEKTLGFGGPTKKKISKANLLARGKKLASMVGTRALDPKLMRLIATSGDPARLLSDAARSVVTTAASMPAGSTQLDPAKCYKRVLVHLPGGKIPKASKRLKWAKISGNVFSVNAPVTELEKLAGMKEVQYVDAGNQMGPALISSVPETRADEIHSTPPQGPGLTGKGVIVGIIDFGFDFTLDDFRKSNGDTRIAFFWDQFLDPITGEKSPADFPHGVEYTASDIDAALASADPFSKVRHDVSTAAHGTHVAGTAAGNGRTGDANFPVGDYVGTAPESTIILVQPATNDNSDTFTDSAHVAEAIRYIFAKADEMKMPCVINMSLGQNGGSHDGESLVERAIDDLLGVEGRAFVVAGGNEHVWRTHASGRLSGSADTLRWVVGQTAVDLPPGFPPGVGDFSPNEMEIWYSSRDRFRVRVRDPLGNVSPAVEPGEADMTDLGGGDSVFVDSTRFTALNGDARVYIEISRTGFDPITEGTWEVELEPIEIVDGRYDAWIERDVRRNINRFRDQSFFKGTDFDPVRTLGTPATGRRSIAVANYDHTTETPAPSSGRGTTRDGRQKPEVAAPGTNIFSSNSLGGQTDANGNVIPARVRMSGTSMAAPHVAGIVALLLESDPRLTSEQIRKILVASARPPVGVTPFEPAWGFGKTDAQEALNISGS